MTQFTQTTTADVSQPIPKYGKEGVINHAGGLDPEATRVPVTDTSYPLHGNNPPTPPEWRTVIIIIAICIAVVIAGYLYGKSQGAKETKAKQAYEQAESDIKAVEQRSEADNTETRSESKSDREQAKIIRDNAFTPIPKIRDTTEAGKIYKLKIAKP